MSDCGQCEQEVPSSQSVDCSTEFEPEPNVIGRRYYPALCSQVTWGAAVLPKHGLPESIRLLRTVDAPGLTFVLRGTLHDFDCSALWVSGAGPNFVSQQFVEENNLPRSERSQTITLANGQPTQTLGSAKLKIQLHGSGTDDCTSHLDFAIMPLAPGIECILGDSWSRKEGIIADYGRSSDTETTFLPPNLWIRTQKVRIMPDASLYSEQSTLNLAKTRD